MAVQRRIQVIGPSGSGKSTIGARLAEVMGVPHVELDAINWLPGWVERDHNEFRSILTVATEGDRWVVSGNYTSRMSLWDRADTIVWLDLPLHVTIPRQLIRSWRRWRSRELLWGTNFERFWSQLAIWDPKRSIVGWVLSTHATQRAALADATVDPRWAHLRFVRLTSQREINRFVDGIARDARQHPTAEEQSA